MGIFLVAENLKSSLIVLAGVGQRNCPVLVVGHSLGGLLMKEVCIQASHVQSLRTHTVKYQNFLRNVKGFFFYSTPHLGLKLGEQSSSHTTGFQWGDLMRSLEFCNAPGAQRNSVFDSLCRKYEWKAWGVGESNSEASARFGCDSFCKIPYSDHFTICMRARKTKESAACSANSQSGVIGSQISSQMGTPVKKSRDRAGHICSQSGEEVQLFHFFIEIAEPRHELEVWERAGQELLKMTGQEFFEKYGRDRHFLHKFVSTHLASTPWTITVIGKPSTEGYLRVLSCSRVGITSPIRSYFLVNPSQPHVGIVQIASDSPDRRMSAVGISSSYNSFGSLAALKRLQARVDMIAKEVAEVIAIVKLEQEPEEFADSTSD
ncbi:hypothetical protein R1sor_004546 [Riccia sorocarpa]|uniref:DUF676 domain-containing protein n=1 Tax=Riccia sorocarpa TaxID=122646 RepID=A0ABD3HKS4_9MARC